MGILDRLSTLIKSNLNAAVDRMSDPAKEIDQLVLEMEDNQRKARGEVQAALALEKRQRQKADALKKSAAEWEARAERAVAAGDEGLAKEALKRKLEADAELREAEAALAEQTGHAEKLTVALKALDQRIKEIKLRKETLKAQAAAHKSRERGTGPTEAFNRFDNLATGIDVKEAEVALDAELNENKPGSVKTAEVERRFDELSKDQALEDRLAALKAKLDKK